MQCHVACNFKFQGNIVPQGRNRRKCCIEKVGSFQCFALPLQLSYLGPLYLWAYHLPTRRPSCHVAPPGRPRGLTWPCHASAPHQRHAGIRVGLRGAATWPHVPCHIGAGPTSCHVSSTGLVEIKLPFCHFF